MEKCLLSKQLWLGRGWREVWDLIVQGGREGWTGRLGRFRGTFLRCSQALLSMSIYLGTVSAATSSATMVLSFPRAAPNMLFSQSGTSEVAPFPITSKNLQNLPPGRQRPGPLKTLQTRGKSGSGKVVMTLRPGI